MGLTRTLKSIFNSKRTSRHEPVPDERLKPLAPHFADNFNAIKAAFGNSNDVITSVIRLGIKGEVAVGIVYVDQMASVAGVQQYIKDALLARSSEIQAALVHNPKDLANIIKNHISAIGEVKTVHNFNQLYIAILSGQTVVLLDGCVYGLVADTSGVKARNIEEPATQSVVRGPRDGFTETLVTNISLLRNRIKSPDLWQETMTIGRVTQTQVSLMYIHGIVNDKIVEEARQRLSKIDVDGILESGNIEELIHDEGFTPFPTVYNSERPDVIAGGLLEGRVAIIVDGTPFVLLVPALFVQFYQASEDYYQKAEFASLVRMLRYVCFFISLMAPSLYIAVSTFHQELLPSSLLFSLAAQREGIPFPAFIEALLMEITFEILREAGVRLPKTVGQAVSIVGALVIGQAAVEAGLVSPAMVIIVAITAISNFAIPAFTMGIAIRIIRFIMMIFAASFGLFGITVGMIALVQHLCSLRSFGVPYMSPMAPFALDDQKDTIIRMPLWGLFSRPRFIGDNNRIRENTAPTSKPKRS